jgi:hypothetical protein
MSSWRVSEQLPATLGSFDLVILDEASQSDARELPALLRGKKVLVVGDDRQVSPGAAFISIANIQRLRANYLNDFPFHGQVEPGASLYDLCPRDVSRQIRNAQGAFPLCRADHPFLDAIL